MIARHFPLLFALISTTLLLVSSLDGRPPLFLLDQARLDEIRVLVNEAGTTHREAFEAMKARVDANYIPGTASDIRGDFAREAAMVYLITEDPAYAQAAFVRLEEIYTISVPAGRDAPDAGSGLARAQGIASFATAYNWAYDDWTPEQRQWVWGVLEKALDEYESEALSHPNIGFGSNNSNWSGVVAGAHVMTLIALDLQNVRRYDFQTSRELLRTHLASFGERGWTQEGNYYFALSMEYLLPAMMALRQINDPTVEPSFASRRPHHITMYAGMFNAAQNSLTWGVGGDTFPPIGMTSALLSLVPDGEKGFYRWFYDHYRGIDNPAPASLKYDQEKAGTPYVLIGYPEDIPAENPTGQYPSVIHDTLGGYVLRSGWDGEDDTIVGLWSDINNYERAWNQRDAGLINILSHGGKWGYGPGPATTGQDASFSQILVNGIAHAGSGQGTNLGYEVALNGGYARVGGGSKFALLGVEEAERHVLADFSPAGYSIVATYDRLRSSETQEFGWNLFLPGKAVVIGTEAGSGIDYFHATDATGAYLKAWFIVPGSGFVTDNQAVRYNYTAATADIWVIMATGRGTPPEFNVAGDGLNAVVTLGDSVLTFDAATQRMRCSTLTQLNSSTDPILSALPATGPAPLFVNYTASAVADPGESLNYVWNFEGGVTEYAQSTSRTYDQEGIYLASLGVTDGRGGSDRVLRNIFVGNREPTAHINSSQTIVLPGVSVTLSGAASVDPEGGALDYEWDLGDGRTASGETLSVSWPVEGVYRIFLKVTDSAGLISVARFQIRVENQSPVASFVADKIGGFAPFEVNFDASASYDPEGEPLLYRWDFDDGTVIDSGTPFITHTFTQIKDHRVRLTVIDPAGKSNIVTEWINALGLSDIMPAIPDPGNLAQGLNYHIYRGNPTSGSELPEISTLRVLNGGRSAHYDFDVTSLTNLYVAAFDGYIYAPETGVYAFRLRTQQQARVFVADQRLIQSSFPHSDIYEELIALEAGLHRYRIEMNYAPEFPDGTWPAFSVMWSLPGDAAYTLIPDSYLFSPPALFQPVVRVTPTTIYDGGTVMFESTAVSPDGQPLTYLWEFGDGQTSTERAVAHTYTLASGDDHRTYNAKLTVTDSGGKAVTVGEKITVSRLAGLVISPKDEIRRDRYLFDRRTVSRDITQGVNFAVGEGTVLTFSSELRADLGGAMLADGSYQTRWVSAQPQDWVKFSFVDKDGAPTRYNVTEYSFTSGALGWTTHRDPKDWEVYGSNNADPAPFSMEAGAANPDWILIDSVTGQSGVARIFPVVYSLPNTEAYAHYLFHLRNQSGGVEAELELTEIQLFSYFDYDSTLDGNQPPLPDLIVSDTEIEPALPIEFDASGTVDPDGDWLYYTWDFGDGHILLNQPEVATISHSYPEPGNYTVTLTITDARGLSAQQTAAITVLPAQPNQAPIASYIASSESVLVGTGILFSAGASYDPDGDALHLQWEFGDGVNAEGEIVSHTYYKPGNYNPMLIITDARGRKSTFVREIEVLPPNGGRGVISFNFNRQAGRLNPYRGAGVVSVAYWNDIWQPLVPEWYDSTGAVLDLQVTATGRRSSFSSIYPVPPFDGNAQLGRASEGKTPYGTDEGFSYEFDGIPYAVYDVYVYFGGSAVPDPRAVYVNGEARYVRKQGHGFTGQWTVSEATTAEEAIEGYDLMIWRNVMAPAVLIEMPTRNSDGIAGFQIVDKTGSPDAPPITTIDTPVAGAWFTQGELIHLSGASLAADGPLADPYLSWESSLDGFLGIGASLDVSSLSIGTHTISLTGINSSNLSSTDSVVIDVFAVPSAPAITLQPESLTSYETATIQFKVSATGSPPIFDYQWYHDGNLLEDDSRISGAQSASLVITGLTFADAGNYHVVVTNDNGFVGSDPAELLVNELIAPSVAAAPTGGTYDLGGQMTLAAQISGSRPMTFQWYLNGEALEDGPGISGAHSDTLTILNLTAGHQGSYELIATNAGGQVSTAEIPVNINLPPLITLLRPVNGVAEIPFGTGAWVKTAVTDSLQGTEELQLHWTQIDGPGMAFFTDPYSSETGVVFPLTGTYALRLWAFDGSLSSQLDVDFIVRDDLEGVTAAVGDPLVNDTFDWGSLNLSNAEIPAESGWRFGTNNYSYLATRNAVWEGTGDNLYQVIGGAESGGVIRGSVKHSPRGIQRDFPQQVSGQRWISMMIWLDSGWDTLDQKAIFVLGNHPTYSYGAVYGQGFGFSNDGTGLRLAVMDGTATLTQAPEIVTQQQWLLVIAKTIVNPTGPDSISLWLLNPDDDFGLTEASLGTPDLSYGELDWGDGFNYMWTGVYRPNGPTAVFDFDELRVSTEDGDRGLGQVIAEVDAGIQLGPVVSISPVPTAIIDTPVSVTATVSDLDSFPLPVSVEWWTSGGPQNAEFENAYLVATTATFALPGNYQLRLIADDGAVSTFADTEIDVSSGLQNSYAGWMDSFADDIPEEWRSASVDYSGDGITNLMAYAYGLDPRLRHAGAERPRIQLSATEAGMVADLNVPSGLIRPDLIYSLQVSASLDSWETIAESVGSSTDFVPLPGAAVISEVVRFADRVEFHMANPAAEEGVFLRLQVLPVP